MASEVRIGCHQASAIDRGAQGGAALDLRMLTAPLIKRRGHAIFAGLEEADLAPLHLPLSFKPHTHGLRPTSHPGLLGFLDEKKARKAVIYNAMPTIVDMSLDRLVSDSEIPHHTIVLHTSFSALEDAVLDVLFGVTNAEGQLPCSSPKR
ncbi:hypothetical protein F5X97DRAFT_325148 [Nemania serpens]|nr:hypothetical protein F5X97DRAFT_325148 [Nemania serpens]